MLKHQRGLGIVELLVGIAVGMIVVAAAMSLLQTSLNNSNANIKMARLEQDLRQAMQLLSRDLRRATSWDAATDVAQVSLVIPLTLSANTGTVTVSTSVTDTTGVNHLADIGDKGVGGTLFYRYYDSSLDTNGDGVADGGYVTYQGSITSYSSGAYTATLVGTWPATAATADGIAKGSWNILRPQSGIVVDEAADCVLFVYDRTPSGTYTSSEYFGYRYDNTDKAVEVRFSGASSNSCTSGGSWENLTDDDFVEVTDFTIADDSPAPISSSGLTVTIREYTISITGRLKSDAGISRTLQETIRVRNDRVS